MPMKGNRRRVFLDQEPYQDLREEVAAIFYGDFSRFPTDLSVHEFFALHAAIKGYDLAQEFGYGDLGNFGNERIQHFATTGRWEGGALELWLILFWYCRKARHTETLPSEIERRSLILALRQRLQNPSPEDPQFVGYRPERNHERPSDLLDRFEGALLGLAAGDAIGTTVEFSQPGSFKPVTDMKGGGPFRLAPGQWTDDTSMALCLAESLIERGFDPADQMRRYVQWFRRGYLSSTGECFDIGNTVRQALMAFEQSADPYSGSTAPKTAGNGSLMRLAPIPMVCFHSPTRAMDLAADSSRTTHGAEAALDACRYFSGLILGALKGYTKEELLASRFCPVDGYFDLQPLCSEIDAIARGSFKRKKPPDIRGTGYVVQSLEAALWAFDRGESFSDCVLLAVNLGEDADTTAAICGQLAGAYYGAAAIPEKWRKRLAQGHAIQALASSLYGRACQDLGQL